MKKMKKISDKAPKENKYFSMKSLEITSYRVFYSPIMKVGLFWFRLVENYHQFFQDMQP
jgi:hypothetical protein